MRFTDLINIMSSNGINSLADIARELNVSPQSVSNWKARNRIPYKYVLEVQSRFEGVREAGELATSPAEPLVSHFTPTYGMDLNLF